MVQFDDQCSRYIVDGDFAIAGVVEEGDYLFRWGLVVPPCVVLVPKGEVVVEGGVLAS